MVGLHGAIRRRDWDLTALYLALAVVRSAARLPEGAAADLLDLLDSRHHERPRR